MITFAVFLLAILMLPAKCDVLYHDLILKNGTDKITPAEILTSPFYSQYCQHKGKGISERLIDTHP